MIPLSQIAPVPSNPWEAYEAQASHKPKCPICGRHHRPWCPTPVPEPESFGVGLVGLLLIFAIYRKFKSNAR
jgi:hypothetical protein